MLYHNPSSIEGFSNYLVTIKGKSKNLESFRIVGVMNNKEIEIPFGASLTNEGDMKGAGGMVKHLGKALKNLPFGLSKVGIGKFNAVGDMLGNAIEKGVEVAGGINDAISDITGVDLSKRTAIYSVVRPDSWTKPSISFTCTFYKGLTLDGYATPTFREFAQYLAKPMLPTQSGALVTSLLESNQLTLDEAMELIFTGMGDVGLDTSSKGVGNKYGFSVTIGKFMSIPGGLWLTQAPITAPTVFDSSGQPLFWDVKFEFEYYRMPTYDDVQSWFNTNAKG